MASSSNNRIILVGGCGYVGRHLALALSGLGFSVLCLDVTGPSFEVLSAPSHGPKVLHRTVDVAKQYSELLNIFGTFHPVLVICIVGWGMSGADMLDKRCHEINVLGTENILRACHDIGINKLIYTSTYNVVFGGHEIEDGDEHLPYFPLDQHTDEYSKSKTIAEQLVLKANGVQTSTGSTMQTAVIRPAAIYGEGEQRHLPRIVKHIDNGLFVFIIGHAIVDWVYIDNLVQAFVRLSHRLLTATSSSSIGVGQTYFISDGTPTMNFDFFMPLVKARRRAFPRYEVGQDSARYLSWLLEDIYWLTALLGHPLPPMLTRAEVNKVAVTHYFSIQKARDELGYSPTVTSAEGAARIAATYAAHGDHDFFAFASPIYTVLVLLGMSLLAMSAFRDMAVPLGSGLLSRLLLAPSEALGLAIFRSQLNLQYVFYGAVAVHVLEALVAWAVADKVCKNTQGMWIAQTLLLGYPSLSLLLERTDKDHHH